MATLLKNALTTLKTTVKNYYDDIGKTDISTAISDAVNTLASRVHTRNDVYLFADSTAEIAADFYRYTARFGGLALANAADWAAIQNAGQTVKKTDGTGTSQDVTETVQTLKTSPLNPPSSRVYDETETNTGRGIASSSSGTETTAQDGGAVTDAMLDHVPALVRFVFGLGALCYEGEPQIL